MRSRQRTNQQEIRQPALVVELSRTRGAEQFSCSLADWNFIAELGRTFGWQPAGTTYLPQHGERARLNPIKHGYQPGGSQDSKRVEADDAARWVAALDVAKRSPFIAGILRTHTELRGASRPDAERPLHAQLHSFIEFARRGAFTIALRGAE